MVLQGFKWLLNDPSSDAYDLLVLDLLVHNKLLFSKCIPAVARYMCIFLVLVGHQNKNTGGHALMCKPPSLTGTNNFDWMFNHGHSRIPLWAGAHLYFCSSCLIIFDPLSQILIRRVDFMCYFQIFALYQQNEIWD